MPIVSNEYRDSMDGAYVFFGKKNIKMTQYDSSIKKKRDVLTE